MAFVSITRQLENFNTPAKTTRKRHLPSIYVAFIQTLSSLSYDCDCERTNQSANRKYIAGANCGKMP